MGQILDEQNGQGGARQSLGGVPHSVATLTDLRQSPVTDLAGLAIVMGGIAAGDGLGGIYWWNAASAAADNGTTVIRPAIVGTGNGRWTYFTALPGGPAVVALVDAVTVALNAALGNVFDVTLSTDRILGAPTNPRDGQIIIVRVTQGAVGSHLLTYDGVYGFGTSFPSPTLSTAVGAIDVLQFQYNAVAVKWQCTSIALGF